MMEAAVPPVGLIVRDQFPALTAVRTSSSDVCSQAIFCDAPGGTQVHGSVIDAVANFYTHQSANLGCPYSTGEATTSVVTEARRAAADFLGCDISEVVFGPSMTSLAFQLAQSLSEEMLEGDEVVVTRQDHDGNISPWLRLAERKGLRLRWVELCSADLSWDLASLRSVITPRTKLVAIGYAANSTGAVNNVRLAVELAHSVGAYAIVDAVHAGPHRRLDARKLGCDFLFCSVYKFFGPHIALMFGRSELLLRLPVDKVRPLRDSLPSVELPLTSRWERGTQNHEHLAGMLAAIDYLANLSTVVSQAMSHFLQLQQQEQQKQPLSPPPLPKMATSQQGSRRDRLNESFALIETYEAALAKRFLQGLQELEGAVTLYGSRSHEPTDRVPTFSIRLEGVSPRALCTFLGLNNIFSSHGSFYAYELCTMLGLLEDGGWLRIGFVHYHTLDDVDAVLACLRRATTELRTPV
eukprot:gnl/Hemi2/13685_TR4659_c0_g1_i1.p1 gnl/Hemi2/13685_TR4659_c0_g1~~gnl/Hemi2/13685_TR4659_c0_g1_i1.p1  ORF type:complete len:467 (-),score=136.47 gnl/Hemi2/13685_TR4659_c0_g1_i1:58-1458(-)